MAFSLTRLRDGMNVEGKWTSQIADVALGTYATGGVTISPSAVGLKKIYGARILGYKDTTAGGYEVKWDYDSNKLMAFRTAAASVTGNVTVVGGSVGEAIGINPDSNAGVLSKAAATNRTIPIATFLGAAPAVATAPLAEVANAVDLTSVVVRVQFIGLGS